MSPPAGTIAGRWPLVSAGLTVLLLGVGVALTFGYKPWTWLIVAVFMVLVGAGLRRLSRPARILLAVLMIAGLTSALDDAALFTRATHSAAFLISLIAALLLLGRIFGRARDIRECAAMLVSQPQGARYLAITLGTHLLAIILNFGVIVLVSAFLSPQRDALERQGAAVALTLAMLRGFAAMPMWSPLALSVLITLALVPEVSYWHILPFGLCGGALYLLAGIVLDRRGAARRTAVRGAQPAGISAAAGVRHLARPVLARVLARTVALVGGVIVLHWVSGLAMINSVFLLILCVIGWSALGEVINRAAPSGLPGDLGAVGQEGVNELVILATAAFVGTVLTHYVQGIEDLMPLADWPMIALLGALVPAIMVACGAVAINPILSGTVLIGALKPIWPDATLHLLAVSVILGWGIASAGTPFTANILIAARSMEIAPNALAYGGNGRLTFLAVVGAGLGIAVASVFALHGAG